jgi:hypothetical protein
MADQNRGDSGAPAVIQNGLHWTRVVRKIISLPCEYLLLDTNIEGMRLRSFPVSENRNCKANTKHISFHNRRKKTEYSCPKAVSL